MKLILVFVVILTLLIVGGFPMMVWIGGLMGRRDGAVLS